MKNLLRYALVAAIALLAVFILMVAVAALVLPGTSAAAFSSASLTAKSKAMRSFDDDKDRDAAMVPGGMPAAAGLAALGEGAGGMEEKRKQLSQSIDIVRGPQAAMALAREMGPLREAQSTLAPPTRTRSWFPETFLFDPLLVTDAHGEGALDVKIPDRLTTWRVLALAHSREGAQAGAETTFLGTLATYVDPVVPASLRVGDEVKLPLQVVNTTDAPVSVPLTVEAVGAKLASETTMVKVAARSSTTSFVTLDANAPGKVTIEAKLAGGDAVVREFPVLPEGRLLPKHWTGTLGSARELALDLPPDVEPGSAHARLVAYPGALALLRSELESSTAHSRDTYALWMTGVAPALLAKLGDTPDNDALRTATLIETQRFMSALRGAGLESKVFLAKAALAHPESAVLSRAGERLVAEIAAAQRPDGTFGGGDGTPLANVLTFTAEAVSVVRDGARNDAGRRRAAAVSLKASGAIERHLALVQDASTAAALVACGAAPAADVEPLRKIVRAAIETQADGSAVIHATDDENVAPSESIALAILALDPEVDATTRTALGNALVARYVPGEGWGNDEASMLALDAVTSLFAHGLPAAVHVTLERDGEAIASGELAPKAKDALELDAPLAKLHDAEKLTVRADPPVPGLAFSLEVDALTPWSKEPMQSGLELDIARPKELKVGVPATLEIEAAAPANTPLTIEVALPAGVQPDEPSLDALVASGVVTSFTVEANAIRLQLPARAAGQLFRDHLTIVPTLAGTLHADASTVAPSDRPALVFHLAPDVWQVR